MDNAFLKKTVINYLHYYHKYEINEAVDIYNNNAIHFAKVYDFIGMDFLNVLLSKINGGGIDD